MNKTIKIILCIFAVLILVGIIIPEEQKEPESTPNWVKEIPISPTVESIPLSERNIAKYNWEFSTTNYIGEYYTSPYGYKYAVITYRLKNDGYNSISTNPFNWVFEANGVIYTYDSTSHSDEINTISVDVGNGGNIVNKIVFLVPSTVESGSFYYNPLFGYDGFVIRDISLVI